MICKSKYVWYYHSPLWSISLVENNMADSGPLLYHITSGDKKVANKTV